MSPEPLQTLIDAAKLSARDLADALLAEMEERSGAGLNAAGNEPTGVVLARLLASQEFKAYLARLRAALMLGIETWDIAAKNTNLSAACALLVKSFSDPEIAQLLFHSLRNPSKASSAFSRGSPHLDLLVEAILNQAQDKTVRRSCVELAFDPAFERFVVLIFLRLVRIDASVVPIIADRVLEIAPLSKFTDGRPSYMVGFDRDLNLVDVQNIIGLLNSDQVRGFTRHFLSYSRRFPLLSYAHPFDENYIEEGADVTSEPSGLQIIDEKRGGSITPQHQINIFEGEYENFLANKEWIILELKNQGVQTRSLLAA